MRLGHKSRWLLTGLIAIIALSASLLPFPRWMVRLELGSQVSLLAPEDLAKAINDIRLALLQAFAGLAVLIGGYVAYRQFQISRAQLQLGQQGQVTERFSRSIDQLGHRSPDIRVGGIYALGRIALDSPQDRTTINEILTVFVRTHAPWPPRLPKQPVPDMPIKEVPEMLIRAPDIHAAMTVLCRREPSREPQSLNPTRVDLRKLILHDEANLENVHLSWSNLEEARLTKANLSHADLYHANISGAGLSGVDLRGAHCDFANLQRSWLEGANLEGAQFVRANLSYASLRKANLRATDLHDADLARADLRDACVRGTRFGVSLQLHELAGQLDKVNLQGAEADAGTVWSDGRPSLSTSFDWKSAGVTVHND